MEIAKLFNETGVKTPVEFKIEKGRQAGFRKGEGSYGAAPSYAGYSVMKSISARSLMGTMNLLLIRKFLIRCRRAGKRKKSPGITGRTLLQGSWCVAAVRKT